MLVFVEEGKPDNPEKKNPRREQRGQGLAKLNPHIWHGAGIEPRPHWWKASVPTTAPFLHHPNYTVKKSSLEACFSPLLRVQKARAHFQNQRLVIEPTFNHLKNNCAHLFSYPSSSCATALLCDFTATEVKDFFLYLVQSIVSSLS